MDIALMKEKWTGWEFDERSFEIAPEKLQAFAEACGERLPKFVDPSHPDFQAVPNFSTSFHGRRQLPDGFPMVQEHSYDGGKSVVYKGPIRAGDTIVAKSHIHDIYEKTGRSGTMRFVVHRMHFSNQRNEEVAIVDWSLIEKLG